MIMLLKLLFIYKKNEKLNVNSAPYDNNIYKKNT